MNFLQNSSTSIMSVLERKEDLFEPIKKYWEDVGCKNLQVYDEINEILSKNKLINSYNKYIDNACYHTINYYENINLLMSVNLSKKEIYNYYMKKFKTTHTLYGIKTIQVKFNILFKILYQIQYQHIYDYDELVKQICKDYLFCNNYESENIEINVLLLINRKDEKIVLENMEDSILFYAENSYTKRIISSIFFNQNSLKFMEMQNLKNVLSEKYKNALQEFHKLKENIFTYNYFTQEKIMLCSSIILMLMGLRLNNDIDIYVDDIDKKEELISEFKKIDKLDFVVKNSEYWPSHWDNWLDEWAKECGAKYFEEIIGFNDYYFYFCGIKIMDLNVDIVRRKIRNRPASSTDLIMLNNKYFMNITIPKIPETYFEYKKMVHLSDKETNNLVNNGAIYDENNREYKIEKKTNTNNYIKKVEEYLQNRYDCHMSNEEIKNIFNVKKRILKIKLKK